MFKASPSARIVGRYALHGAIAAGGMATVHLGRLVGPVGFSRTVAIKKLHAQYAADAEFVAMFLDEARIAARVRHPNVIPTLDVIATDNELFLVMEYVAGESIARLSRVLGAHQRPISTRVLCSVMAGVLHGLHAAHEATDEHGQPLNIVHRDVSPQNVLVGADGVARILDFGVAKAAGRTHTTRDGDIKGKLSYMPPEQLRGGAVNRQSDIYSAGIMLWELVTGERLFAGDNEGAVVAKVLGGHVAPPSKVLMAGPRRHHVDDGMMRAFEDLDQTILRALAMDPKDRFATARQMAAEVERKFQAANASEVSEWLDFLAHDVLKARAAMVSEIESHSARVATSPREMMPQGAPLAALETHVASGYPPTPSTPSTPSAPSDDPERRRRRKISVAAFGCVVIGCFVIGVFAAANSLRNQGEPSVAPRASVAPSVSANVDTFANVGAAPVVQASGSVAGEGPSKGPPNSSKDATALTPIAPLRPIERRTTAISPLAEPKPARTSVADCMTPTWFDAQGVKHYKPQCLNK